MKYDVVFSNDARFHITVEADSPDEAIKKANEFFDWDVSAVFDENENKVR